MSVRFACFCPSPIRTIIRKIINRVSHRNKFFAKASYSQLGEDIIMSTILSSMFGLKKWSWLDIGCHHPKFLSNTAVWYDSGMRGINVDANSLLMKEFYKKRKRDINLNIAISDIEGGGGVNFYIMEASTLSTLSESEAKRYETLGQKIKDVVPVETMTVANVVKKYNNGVFPDVLCLDAEGYDLPILKTIDWETAKPTVICVESIPFEEKFRNHFESAQQSEIVQYLISKGYATIAFTGINTIMVCEEATLGR